MSYLPGGSCGNTNRPSPSVFVTRLIALERSEIVTEAAGTAACWASTTLPAMEPLVVCAGAKSTNAKERTTKAAKNFMETPKFLFLQKAQSQPLYIDPGWSEYTATTARSANSQS